MVGATCSPGRWCGRGRDLSVSSTDRWSVQHGVRLLPAVGGVNFQYPLRIDGRCNKSPGPGIDLASSLSVSSTDRWSVQHLVRVAGCVALHHFQYPLRIDGRCNPLGALRPSGVLVLSVSSTDRWSVQHRRDLAVPARNVAFSILYGSMVGATPRECGLAVARAAFQYPLRIDGRCNLIPGLPGVADRCSFSILYGSMVGATSAGPSLRSSRR